MTARRGGLSSQWIASLALAMTARRGGLSSQRLQSLLPPGRHCEARSAEAIHLGEQS